MHALSGLGRLGDYLESRGERGYPAEPRARAEFALRVFLSRVFEESTDFALSPERLERAYGEVESALYDGRTETVVIAPLLGLEIASPELALGDGLTLVQGDAFPEDAPADALWAPGARRPHLLVVVRWEAAAGDTTPVAARPGAAAAPAHARCACTTAPASASGRWRGRAPAARRGSRSRSAPSGAAARSRSPSPPTRRTSCAPSAR